MPETPEILEEGEARETFAETLAAVAEAGRGRMRATPLAEIGALHRRRRRRRIMTVAVAAATSCAVVVGVALASNPAGHTTPSPLPPVGPTLTVASSPPPASQAAPSDTARSDTARSDTAHSRSAPSDRPSASSASTGEPTGGQGTPAEFLSPADLPEASVLAWYPDHVTSLHDTLPLPITCGRATETATPQRIREVGYSSSSGPEKITEDVYTYDTPATAAAALAKITPACGDQAVSVRTADGFGWTEPFSQTGLNHMIVGRHGRWIAVLQYRQHSGWRSYSNWRDPDVLATMTTDLQAAAVPGGAPLSPDLVPFPNGSPWTAPTDRPGREEAVTDVCAAAWDPVDTTSGHGHPAPDTLERSWAPGNPADVSPAVEHIHVFVSTADAAAEYQKAKALYAAQTCHHTEDTVGDVTSVITPGGSLNQGSTVRGFAIGRADSSTASVQTGTMGQFRSYVVLGSNAISVLSVPVAKNQVADSSGDQALLTILAARVP